MNQLFLVLLICVCVVLFVHSLLFVSLSKKLAELSRESTRYSSMKKTTMRKDEATGGSRRPLPKRTSNEEDKKMKRQERTR